MFVRDDVVLLEATRRPLDYKGRSVSGMVYAVIEPEWITLIDTGFPSYASGVIAELGQVGEGKPLKRVLLTHADADHIGNAYEIQEQTGCSVYISEKELPYINSVKQRFGQKQRMYEGFGIRTPTLLTYPAEGIDPFTVIPTPGHSDGHVCILYKDILFSGDLCSYMDGIFKGPNPEWTENMDEAERSLQAVASWPFSEICPAHGIPFARDSYI
jgi:glyoxylase-like metal-dependent hydrolase (beta-lactamase superfamily II)